MDTKTKTCDACGGKGYVMKADIMRAKTSRDNCAKCHGRGEIVELPSEGIRYGRLLGEFLVFMMMKEGKVISKVIFRFLAVIDKSGRPLVKINRTAMFKKDKEIPRLYCEIFRVSKDISGLNELLEYALGDKRLEWVEMDSYEAEIYGISTLLADLGFKPEGTKLIKELTHDKEEPTVTGGIPKLTIPEAGADDNPRGDSSNDPAK